MLVLVFPSSILESWKVDTILFEDRNAAAAELIEIIPPVDPAHTILLGIPRGGVPMAVQLADALHVPMDILLIRKLTSSSNPEYAIGAVSLEQTWVDERSRETQTELDEAIHQTRELLRSRDKLYRQQKPFPSLQQKTVILVDDGIATGRTLLHAIQLVRQHQPQAVWVAVPVSSIEAANRIRPLVNRFLCLHQPDPFICVGRFYRSFPAVTDPEVIQALGSAPAKL